ncbi:MAG: SpoIIIAH-like family protein [Desulfobacteraceae bacterium]|nr:SpoIIIAH-like family protein [Desulfobacteraceae bacterium]
MIKQFSQKLLAYLVFRRFLAFGTVYLFICGTVLMLLRTILGIPATFVFWAFAGIIPLLPTAFFYELKKMPDKSCVTALLDKYNNMDGLLMAQDEADTSPWLALKGEVRCPVVVWHCSREWIMFGMAVLFVAATVFTPHCFSDLYSDNKLDTEEITNQLNSKTELLEEEEIIDHSKALEIKNELDQLAREASGENPARTWEALDHISESIFSEAENASEELLAMSEKLSHAQNMAELLNQAGDLKPEVKEAAMEELAKMLKNAGNEAFDLSDFLDKNMMKSIKNSSLTQAQMKKLASDLKVCKKKITGKIGRMCQTGLADKKLYNKSAEVGQFDNSALANFLKENAGKLTMTEISSMCLPGGKGGVNRGRGDAMMTWKKPSHETGTRFKEEELPLSALPSASKSMTTGISPGVPEKNKEPVPAGSGALSGTEPGEASAITDQPLPRHRGIIRRYFDRQKDKQHESSPLFDEIWSGWS